jgi:hypothetical protein
VVANLLEKSLPEPAISCDGEPAPDRVAFAILPGLRPGERPKGDRIAEADEGSFGEPPAVVGDVERVWLADCDG